MPRASRPDYLKKILTARVYDVAIETPLEPARSLSRRLGQQVLLKRLDKLRAGSSGVSIATS